MYPSYQQDGSFSRLTPRGYVYNIPGAGNHAFRRMLARFRVAGTARLEPVPAFAAKWREIIAASRGDAEDIAYRLAKLSNRPLGEHCPPSWQVSNAWMYQDNFVRCIRL